MALGAVVVLTAVAVAGQPLGRPAGLSAPSESAAARAAAEPRFNWATVPLYWYSADPKAPFNDTVAWYAASHPVVVINGNHERFVKPAQAGEEAKLHATARRLKSLNHTTSVLFYLNSMMDWVQYDLHGEMIARHHEWWVKNEVGETVCLDGQPLFNHTITGMRQLWLDTLAQAMATGLYAGVFADRANPLPKGHKDPATLGAGCGIYDDDLGTCTPATTAPPFVYSAWAYERWAEAHAAVLATAQAASTPLMVVANNNATPGVRGRHFEKWAHADFDGDTIVGDLVQLQQAASRGELTLVHGGEPCDADALSLSLAAFLVGAGRLSYFGCTDGWTVDGGWMDRPVEYDLPLGPPLGLATSSVGPGGMAVYSRCFASGTEATLHVPVNSNGPGASGCVFWGNGHVTGASEHCLKGQ